MELGNFIDLTLPHVVQQLTEKPDARFPSWQILINEVVRINASGG